MLITLKISRYIYKMLKRYVAFATNMCNLRDKTIFFMMSACVITCMSQRSYTGSVPSEHCKPCFSRSSFDKQCSDKEDERRRVLNDTFDAVKLLRPILGKIEEKLESEDNDLADVLGADRRFDPYSIPDLENIENSRISNFLRAGNPIERILHLSHGRTILLVAHLRLYQDVLNESEDLDGDLKEIARTTRVKDILKHLKELSCKLYDFTFMFGVRKPKKKVCSYLKVQPLNNSSDKNGYMRAVLTHGLKSFKAMYNDIDSLDSNFVLDTCKYECKKNKRKLDCGEDKKELRSSQGRRNKKRKGKGKRRNKNRRNMEKKQKRNENRKQRKRGNKRRHKGKKNRKNAQKGTRD